VISVLKYRGPRKTLRPIAGGLANGLEPFTVVPKIVVPGTPKMPFGRRKLSFVLSAGCAPVYEVGRRSQKLAGLCACCKHPEIFGVHGKPSFQVTIELICQPPRSLPFKSFRCWKIGTSQVTEAT